MAKRTEWFNGNLGNDSDTTPVDGRTTLNMAIKALEDAGNTVDEIVPCKGGILIVYSTP